MVNVYCTKDISFSIREEEKEILQKAHNIIEEIRNNWFLQDNNAWDSEDYWEIDNTVKMLERLFECKKETS